MAIVFDENGKYVDEKGFVKLDPTQFADWQIAEEAEKTLPPVDFFRQKLGLLEEEIIPYGKTPQDRLHQGYEPSDGQARWQVHRSHRCYPHSLR